MERAQLIPIMQAFSAALGVTCNHCHVFNGPGDPMNDFVGDTKPTKNMARAMMRMVTDMNAKVPEAIGKPADQAAVPRRRPLLWAHREHHRRRVERGPERRRAARRPLERHRPE